MARAPHALLSYSLQLNSSVSPQRELSYRDENDCGGATEASSVTYYRSRNSQSYCGHVDPRSRGCVGFARCATDLSSQRRRRCWCHITNWIWLCHPICRSHPAGSRLIARSVVVAAAPPFRFRSFGDAAAHGGRLRIHTGGGLSFDERFNSGTLCVRMACASHLL